MFEDGELRATLAALARVLYPLEVWFLLPDLAIQRPQHVPSNAQRRLSGRKENITGY